jgi:hypothetical protein
MTRIQAKFRLADMLYAAEALPPNVIRDRAEDLIAEAERHSPQAQGGYRVACHGLGRYTIG